MLSSANPDPQLIGSSRKRGRRQSEPVILSPKKKGPSKARDTEQSSPRLTRNASERPVDLQNKIKLLKNELEDANLECSSLLTSNASLQSWLTEESKEKNQLKQKLSQNAAEINSLTAENNKCKTELAGQDSVSKEKIQALIDLLFLSVQPICAKHNEMQMYQEYRSHIENQLKQAQPSKRFDFKRTSNRVRNALLLAGLMVFLASGGGIALSSGTLPAMIIAQYNTLLLAEGLLIAGAACSVHRSWTFFSERNQSKEALIACSTGILNSHHSKPALS